MNEACDYDSPFLHLPIEILERILLFCPLSSLYSLSATCKLLNGIIKSDHIWQLKWKYIVAASNLDIDDPSRENEHENFYFCSQRLLRVCFRLGIGIGSITQEHSCETSACTSKCKDNDQEKKFAFDIGSKITWIMTSGYFLERHPSVLVIPESDINLIKKSSFLPNGINYASPQKVNCLLCHHDLSDAIKNKKNILGPQLIKTEQLKFHNSSGFGLDLHEEPGPSSLHSSRMPEVEREWSTTFTPIPKTSNPLMQRKYKLWSEISYMLRDAKIDHSIFHPAQCFFGTEDFRYLEQYLHHLIYKHKMEEDIKKGNSSLVFCEPFNCSMEMRHCLSKFFIESLQAKRICFLNKALATALLFGVGTCIVIDSGARNTVISVILEGVVQNHTVQHCPVGGTEIAQYLADAIKLSGLKNDVYVPSLDSDRVKSRCFLALNPRLEEKRGSATKRKVFVRCMKEGPGPHLEEIRLGSELYLAPELMYAAMDLTNRIKLAVSGFDTAVVKEIFSHIILTGSNTELKGLSTRLARDMQASFPQHSHSIFLKSNSGSHSWDAVTGAMYVPIMYRDPIKLTESFWPPNKLTSGSIMWVTREDYILKGPALFEE